MTHYNPDPDLTAAESAAIDEGNAADAAALAAATTPAAVVDEPAVQVAATTPVDDAAVRLADAATKLAGAAEAITARANEPTAAQEAAPVVVARDFDGEIAALEQKFDDGDLDLAEYRKAERRVLREQTLSEVAEQTRRDSEQRDQQVRVQNETNAQQQWEGAQGRFFADPGNAALVADPIKAAGFKAAIDLVFQEAQGSISYDDVLVKARERLTGVAAIDPNKAINDATFARQQNQPNAAQTLRDAPNASNPGDSPGASLDNLDINSLEDKLFRMSDADRAAYLANAPGGLSDNPRATS